MNNIYRSIPRSGDVSWVADPSANWRADYPESGQPVTDLIALLSLYGLSPLVCGTMSTTALTKVWEPMVLFEVRTAPTTARGLSVVNLGWSMEEVIETRMRLRVFEEDWDAPGMEAYDAL